MAKKTLTTKGTTATLGGSAFLEINGTPVVLTSKSLHPKEIRLEYHADSFLDAANLGSLDNAISEINKKLEGLSIDTSSVTGIINQAKNVVPGLARMLSADIMLTDFVIDSPGKQFEIGLGMNFTTAEIAPVIGNIQLDGFSILLSVKGAGSETEKEEKKEEEVVEA